MLLVRKIQTIDVRGIITLIISKQKGVYCFDIFRHFNVDGIIYSNKKLMSFIIDNIYPKGFKRPHM